MASPKTRRKRPLSAKDRRSSHHRNAWILFGGLALLIIIAVLVAKEQTLNIDPGKSTKETFRQKIIFTGDLKMNDLGLTDADLSRLGATLNRYSSNFQQIQVWAEKQDTYAAMGPDTQLRYKLTLITRDGVKIQSVVGRTKPSTLVHDVLWRLKEDINKYHETREKVGDSPGSFSNTM